MLSGADSKGVYVNGDGDPMTDSKATDPGGEVSVEPDVEELQLDAALRVISEVLLSPRRAVALPDYLSTHEDLGQIIDALLQVRSIIFAMANGDFSRSIPLKGFLGGSLKALQAHLNHLSWQTKMVAQGDFSQRVDFMGEFSESFNAMVVQLEEAHRKLAASEERYRSFFASTEAIKLIVNPQDCAIVDANSSAIEFFGYEREQMLTMRINELSARPVDDIEQKIKAAQESGKGRFVSHYYAASGELFDVEVYTSPIVFGDNELLMCSIQDITERKKMEEKLQFMATTDSLTGLNNRFQFMTLGRLYFEAAKRAGTRLAVAVYDVDHFKRVNDTWGHDVGDIVLKNLSQVALKVFRASDVLGRLGGEEFAVVMPETDADKAMIAIERLRQAVANNLISHEGKTLSITISCGITTFSGDESSLERLLKKADEALYIAKRSGRNRTEQG